MTTDLGMFEGSTVSRTTLAIRNAGDGLSQALKVDPQLLHPGDTVFVVLECKVGPINFKPIKDSSETEREHVLNAGAAAIVDGDLVKAAVEAQTAKIIEAREKEKGIQQLPTDKKLLDAHNAGEHDASPYIGCPICTPASGELPKAPTKKPAGKTTGASKPTRPAAKRTRKPAAKK